MFTLFLKRNILGAILTILVLPSIALSAVLLVPQGGTGLSTCSVGGILRGNGQNAMSCLGIGTNGQVLTVSGGQPTWQDAVGGGVSSVAMTVPTGLQVSGSPITDSGTLTVSLASGYVIPLTASTTNWQTAFGWGNHATAGYLDSGDIANFETTTQLNTRDTNNRARANHTGTQLASTISDFSTTARGLFSSSATGLTYTSGTGAFSLTGGYNIPLTASTTNWNTFYNTPSNRITAGTGLSWSGNTLNASGGGTVTSVGMTVPTGLSVSGSPVTTTGTLAVTLTGGYNIPLTASTTNWNTAYGWGNHATAGYSTFTPSTLLADYGFTDNSSNWNTAFGWGDHSIEGYLTEVATTTVRGMISASSPLSYNSGTGVLSFLYNTSNTWTGTNAIASTLFNLTGLSNGCLEMTSGYITSTGVACGSGSGGITSINGLTGASQTFATSTGGNVTLSIGSTGTTHTFTTGVTSGYSIPLTASSTNWNTFYNTPSNRITAGSGLTWSSNTLLIDTGDVTNAMLANSTVSYGGVSLALGATDATPAFALADATGLPITTGVSGLGAGVATFLATPSSDNLRSAVTSDTGTGALVFGTSPSIASPTITSFFGTPCTGNDFLQDISDTGAFTCVTASGGGGSSNWDVVAGGIETATSSDFARAGYFLMSSTTGTSTFAGNVVIEGNLIVDGDIDGAGIIALIALVVATMATVTLTFTNKTLTSPKINVGSDATGDMYYRDAGGNLVRIPAGADGQVLTANSAIPAWEDPAGGASSFARLDFEVMTAPATPANDVGTVYMTGSGTTPNRVIEWKFKNEEGEEIILSSVIV